MRLRAALVEKLQSGRRVSYACDSHCTKPGFRLIRHLALGVLSADFGRLRLWGAPAWWLWGLVHLGFLVGMRNRVATMINWFWAYLTFGGGIRLITGSDPMTPRPEFNPQAGK